jgi:hypothetical protein
MEGGKEHLKGKLWGSIENLGKTRENGAGNTRNGKKWAVSFRFGRLVHH